MSNNIPGDLKYTKSHEWVRQAQNGALEIGITDHAQSALGDLVFVEVPDVGRTLSAGEACAVVESVKAASDVYSPLSGKVVANNGALAGKPELLNEDPYGAGWLFRLEAGGGANVSSLMSASDYEGFVAKESE
ncbi:MAG TPA: glycine cleavage system protein GcvH [Steroidobacteraceae bacterium]|nr:glycine cleavage system protein GcvH [Steroidobacteraceae bacterium]